MCVLLLLRFQLAKLLYIAQDGLELSVSSPQLPENGTLRLSSTISAYPLVALPSKNSMNHGPRPLS